MIDKEVTQIVSISLCTESYQEDKPLKTLLFKDLYLQGLGEDSKMEEWELGILRQNQIVKEEYLGSINDYPEFKL